MADRLIISVGKIRSSALDVEIYIPNMEVMDKMGNRRFERADFKVKGFISCGEKECPVSVLNISMKGILVTIDGEALLEVGHTYAMRISLLHSDVNIITSATLMHFEDGHYGFRFDSIEADSMIHLRRLLELNLSSEDEIERELTFLSK